MQRILSSAILTAVAIAIGPFLANDTTTVAQDVTITITKHDQDQDDKQQKAPFKGKRPLNSLIYEGMYHLG